MSTPTTLGRPADRKNAILQQLRRQIAKGEWLPGSQLPTRSEIEARFQASPATVQSALEELRNDGFIVVNGRKGGTFVATTPPHLTNYALVFPTNETRTDWNRFYTALISNAEEEVKAGRNITVYRDINRHQNGVDFRQLNGEAGAHRLAGIIFATAPFHLSDTAIGEEPGIPRVAIMSSSAREFFKVALDRDSLWIRAAEYLTQRGHRRVAVLTAPLDEKLIAAMIQHFRDAGIILEPRWTQSLDLNSPRSARNLIHLLMHSSQVERPSAILIADDNLVEEATAGLVDAGVRAPEDIELLTHCNFPFPPPRLLPSIQLGYDTREILRACLDSIDAQRQGLLTEWRDTMIPARFESEIP